MNWRIILSLSIFTGMVVLNSGASGNILDVPQTIQEEDQWCWAGSSAAVLAYYNKPLPQCEIAEYTRTVATWHNFGSVNCCTNPNQGCNYWNYNWYYAGSIADILTHWGVSSTPYASALSLTTITEEIAKNKPFIIRWGWASGGGHFIVGHGVSNNTVYYMNPWYGEGLKFADYSWLVTDGNHTWTHSQTTSVPGSISLSDATYSVNENSGNLVVTVKRIGGSGGTVSINYSTVNGSAIAGSDYTEATGTLSWADGDIADKTFSVPITADMQSETDESFMVVLSNPTGGSMLGSLQNAVVTIHDTVNGYTVTATVVAGSGTIICDSPVSPKADSICYIVPSVGWKLLSLTDNKINVLGSVSGNSYKIINVITNHSVSGEFAAAVKAKVGSKEFYDLQTAYNDSATITPAIIKLLDWDFLGGFTAGRNIDIELEGGYNSDFSLIVGEATVQSPFVVRDGTVRVKGIIVK